MTSSDNPVPDLPPEGRAVFAGTADDSARCRPGLTQFGPPGLLAMVYGLPGAQWPYSTVGVVFDGGRLTAEQIRGIALDPREHDEAGVFPLAEWVR